MHVELERRLSQRRAHNRHAVAERYLRYRNEEAYTEVVPGKLPGSSE